MKFIVNFSNNTKLIYDLIDHEISRSWSTLIINHNISDICPNNHYVGYASRTLVLSKIDRLNQLADIINTRVPDRVVKQPITLTDYTNSLSVMHVHFPELKNDENYRDIWNYLTEYNDIIHWLEGTLPSLDHSRFFRITLDFNKAKTQFLPIPDSAYELFTSECNFGDLCLHYTHVGKNANEIFMTNDFVCPQDQFVPQRTFSASVRMHFYDNFHSTTEQKNRLQNNWNQFYIDRGGKDFWGYDIDDPKLAFGFLKIGHISEIRINDEISELNDIREHLAESTIIDWNIE